MAPRARFDDLTPHGEHAFELDGLVEVVEAHTTDQVAAALQRVEDARRLGLWAGGFVAYEAAPVFDPALTVSARRTDAFADLPLVWFGLFERSEPVTPHRRRNGGTGLYSVSGWSADTSSAQWRAGIETIRARIAAGDTYQVNHTLRLRAAFSGDPFEFYGDLALAQRGAYAAYLDTDRFQIASASPELFFEIGNGEITLRPMKGTHPRGRWAEEDAAMAARLEASGKDQAENLMIVDLLRNDVGRIAEFGTVRAERLLNLERYETLWTLTSEITADVPDTLTLWDVFAALFPSGSVTGAPKASTMRIITELENSPRGVYCGAIGYVEPGTGPLSAHFNVAIRTVVIDAEEGVAEYGVGGGITWDSEPESEYEEARTKARLLVERRPEFALLETLRWDEPGGFVLLERHLDRLEGSAEYFGYPFDRSHLVELLDKAVGDLHGSVRVRLLLGRDGVASVEVDERVLAPFAEMPAGPVARVELGTTQVGAQDVFLYHKTTRRDLYEDQRDEHPYAEDVLMVNTDGELTESTLANVVVRFGDVWWTPRLGCGVLPGTYRAELLDQGVIAERTIRVEELRHADEVALINSVRGWRAVELADGDGER